MEYALKVENLTKKYSDFMLDHVNLMLPRGCIMGFIGENGAGKSTTIKLILDLIHKDEGEVLVLGEKPESENRLQKEKIGVVMDESSFPDNLTIRNINTIMKSCYQTWKEGTFLQYADTFGLPAEKPVKDYSRGMKMKLSIAVALSHDSQILILDEATSGLDPIVRDEILDVFLDFIQDEQKSIFISSHILSDLEKICDYITFIHKGKIVFSEQKDELLDKYVVAKCSKEELKAINKEAVIGIRENNFGVEALVRKSDLHGNITADKASMEDIMLYFVKEGKS